MYKCSREETCPFADHRTVGDVLWGTGLGDAMVLEGAGGCR
jgi:hypothetical protein